MTDDLVKRLRICAPFDPDQAEAADRIEALEAGFQVADEKWSKISARCEALEAALVRIWSWYPTNVSNPHQQINEMKDFAFKVIKEGNEDAKPD